MCYCKLYLKSVSSTINFTLSSLMSVICTDGVLAYGILKMGTGGSKQECR